MAEQVRILCVDDESLMLNSLRRFFLDDEYEILTAASAREGLEVMRQKAPVQLVLSDYRMPEENGLEFLRQIARDWPDTVRVIVSGYADLSLINQALDKGEIFRFIPKPWDMDELIETIKAAISLYDERQK